MDLLLHLIDWTDERKSSSLLERSRVKVGSSPNLDRCCSARWDGDYVCLALERSFRSPLFVICIVLTSNNK